MALAVSAATKPCFRHAIRVVSVLIDHDYAYAMCRHALADFMAAFIAAMIAVDRGKVTSRPNRTLRVSQRDRPPCSGGSW